MKLALVPCVVCGRSLAMTPDIAARVALGVSFLICDRCDIVGFDEIDELLSEGHGQVG